jgi:hypothetical protein
MLDEDQAIWLGELILEAIANLADHPAMTIEVDGTPNQWIQAVFEADEDDTKFAGFTLNFPYRGYSGDPLAAVEKAGLKPPPDTKALEWEDDGFATLWIRPDAPVIAMALLMSDILQRMVGALPDASLSAQIEYGF